MSENFKRSQRAYYGTSAAAYEAGDGYPRALDRGFARKGRIICKALGDAQYGSVLEVGAGSGLMTWFTIRQLHFLRYDLLDLSPAMLDRARQRLHDERLSFITADAAQTPFPSECYDVVIGCDIIHHLDNPISALKEWLRVAKFGAALVVLETNPRNPLHLRFIGVEHEVRSWLNTDTNLLRWVNNAGWERVKVVPVPYFTPPGPAFLAPLLDVIDRLSLWVPVWRRMGGLWLIIARKGRT